MKLKPDPVTVAFFVTAWSLQNDSVHFDLSQLQRDVKTGHISEDVYTQQAVEMLTALKKLGENVSTEKRQWNYSLNLYHRRVIHNSNNWLTTSSCVLITHFCVSS